MQKKEKHQLNVSCVLSLVHRVRRDHPRSGGKKLYKWLKPDIRAQGIKLGRDRFFDVLAANDLLIKKRRKHAYTTNSYHRFRTYKNQLKHQELKHSHQGWVSDITYIRTGKDFMYLFLITDAYSRKIVGWHLSPSLAIPGAIQALKMALRQCPPSVSELIHHSDRGIQYCSKGYVDCLKKAGIQISMTQENHCYENAIAERLNGILKQEYGLDETFSSQKQAIKATREAVKFYNQRPHWALDLATPEQIHQEVLTT